MDRIIFGDNQFFGINHRSEEKAIELSIRFRDTGQIIKVIESAYALGIHAFSFSTHDRVQAICDHFRSDPAKFADLRLYPVLPYAHKYADLVAEKGVVGALMDIIGKDNKASRGARMLLSGAEALITRNPMNAMEILVDAELKMFRNLKIEVVFLQNIVTDMLVGLGFKEPFVAYHNYIRKTHAAEAGYMTLNLPATAKFLLECGIENPIVCSAINKIGFQMNPDRESYEEALREKTFRAMAMSPMAAGGVAPREAFEYLASLGQVESILYGASSPAHIRDSMDTIEACFKETAAA